MKPEKLEMLYEYTKDVHQLDPEPTWDRIMIAVTKLHNEYIHKDFKGRDEVFTIQFLLGGGYKFGRTRGNPYPKLRFNKSNLLARVIEAIIYYQNKKHNVSRTERLES